MCLYPRLIDNPKYKSTKKNGGEIPPILDERVKKVPIGCKKCIECKRQRKREWQVRLLEEIKHDREGTFVTLTFDTDNYKKYYNKFKKIVSGYELDNAIATSAIRHFLERWRKKYKKSVKHWLITELGGNGTENIHLHGIIWTKNTDEIKKIWANGFVWTGYTKDEKNVNYINEKTVNYITKYMLKVDSKHKDYEGKILTSAGIGKNYHKSFNAKKNKYLGENTKETYICRNGTRTALPIYYRNKLYSEEERERLWIYKLDKNERYILGTKIDISKGEENYYETLKEAQQLNKSLGYGSNEITWKAKQYEQERRNLKQLQRVNKELK